VSYSNGMNSNPIANKNSVGFGNLLLFSVACLIGIATVTLLFFRVFRREVRSDLIFAGCVAAYSLEILIQYVNRSVGMNFYHVIIPFCVLVIGYVAKVAGSPGPGVGRWLVRTVPLVLVVGSILINPLFREYPGLLRTAIKGPLPKGLCLFDDVCGLPESRRDFIRDIHKVTGRMTELKNSGHRVMVLDSAEPMFYLLSGIKPPDRYTPLVINFVTKDQLERAQRRVADAHFDYMVLGKFGYVNDKEHSDFYASLGEAKSGFSELVERDYVLIERIGPYSLWRARRLEGLNGQR